MDPDRERGQVLVIFVFASIVLMGAAAIAADASWLFVSQQRMQRAADAAALAGAVFLPGDPTSAFATARAEAARNGYPDQTDGVVVQPRTDPGNPRRLIVDIEQGVGTYFARVFCWDGGPCLENVDVGVQGRAEYVLPVPMGSPQNYYGVGQFVDAVTTTSTNTASTDWHSEGTPVSGTWSRPERARSNDNSYTTASSNGNTHIWSEFSTGSSWSTTSLFDDIPGSATAVIGLEVRLSDVSVTGSGSYGSCRVGVQTSWDGGASWSDEVTTGSLSTYSSSDQTVGSASSTSMWGSHAWVRGDLSDGNFRVRLTWSEGTSGCSSSRAVRLDHLEVRASYEYETSSTSIGDADVYTPDGSTVLVPQNFWGTILSTGAAAISGDAYMTNYESRSSSTNDEFDPDSHYQYAVEMPTGSSSGSIYIFDAGFCEVDYPNGAGDHGMGSESGIGYAPLQPMSTYYDVYDTMNTPYNTADDRLVVSSGSAYENQLHYDSLLFPGTNSGTDCRDASWHNEWVLLASGLQGGHTYRVHNHTYDPDGPELNTTAYNSFAIYADATGGTPRVYGLGAMEAYVRVQPGSATEFYLAQIEAEHAGKTMLINLWDAGDTQNLPANLEILKPTSGGYVPTTFSYSARRASNHSSASSCDGERGNNVTSVVTNQSGKVFNGCWLTIEIPLPADYDAPLPSGDPFASEGGWWKVRYNIGGSSSTGNVATDLTTWSVELRGSPVHLVIP